MNTKKILDVDFKRLGKLLKHGFKGLYKEMIILYSAIFGSFMILTLYIRFAGTAFLKSTIGVIIYGIVVMFAVFCLIACYVYTIYNVFKSTTKNMFSDEGYLTFTLPVSVDDLLVSKLIVNFAFIMGALVVSYISLLFMYLIAFSQIVDAGYVISTLLSLIYSPDIIGVLYDFIVVLCEIKLLLLMLLLAMTIVHSKYKGKNKNAIGILCFFLFRYAFNTVSNIINMFFSFGIGVDINGDSKFAFGLISNDVIMYTFNFTTIILYIVSNIVLYLATRKLMSNKLELLGE